MFPPEALIPLIEQLCSLVLGVMRPLGDRIRKTPPCRPEHRLIPEKLVVVIQAWLQKRREMIEALMRRIAAGAHHPRPYRPREIKPGAIAKPRAENPPANGLPLRVFGWINHMASEIGPWTAAMGRFIDGPEMQAMVLASPHLARLWLPLLNAVGAQKPDWWPKPPPRPRRPRPPRPRDRHPVTAGLDPASAAYLAQPPWKPSPPPPPNPLAGIRSWGEFVDLMRPVSRNFEPPPVDDPVPMQLRTMWPDPLPTNKRGRWSG